MLGRDNGEFSKKIILKLVQNICLLFGATYVTSNKGTIILYQFRSPLTKLSPTENGKIQGLFKALEEFSSTFQGRFNLQGFFKEALHI